MFKTLKNKELKSINGGAFEVRVKTIEINSSGLEEHVPVEGSPFGPFDTLHGARTFAKEKRSQGFIARVHEINNHQPVIA